jgi:hypothetical protein
VDDDAMVTAFAVADKTMAALEHRADARQGSARGS